MTHTYGASPDAWKHWATDLDLWDRLLPVVSNPAAVISPESRMASAGKTPSEYNFRRQVRGIHKWTSRTTSQRDIDRWMQEPDYGICVRTGGAGGVFCIDIDVENPRRAQRIVSHIERVLPYHIFPQRSRSDSGNTMLVFRFTGDLTKRVIPVEGGIIEFLGNGQQFVAVGTHPKGQRYEWDGGLPSAFPLLDVDDLDTLWDSLCTAFLAEGEEPKIARERRKIADMADLPPTDDEVASWLVSNWEVHDSGDADELFIRCPFESDHTTETGYSSTAYFPAGTGGYEQGHFVCLHAHCQSRGDTEYLEATGYLPAQFEDLTGGIDENYWPHGASGPDGSLACTSGPMDRPKLGTISRPLPRFTRTKDGGVEATNRNLKLALEREDFVGYWIAYDGLRDELVWGPGSDPRDKVRWRSFRDENYVDLHIILEERSFKPFGKVMLRDVVHNVAKNNEIDLAAQWLARQQWDGVPRVAQFMADYMHAADSEYAKAVSLYAWTAHAGRVMTPGVQADMAIILHGAQGVRKTSAVRAISPHEEMYTSLSLDVSDADNARQLRGKLVGELEELRGLNSKQSESIKAWVSRRVEEWTPKFKEFNDKYRRRTVVWGSTNESEILADSTGERRWLPITVGLDSCGGNIDVDAIERDRDQLWAEGAVLYGKHGVMWQEAERLARSEHSKFAVVDDWMVPIEHWLYEPVGGWMLDEGTGSDDAGAPNGHNPEGVLSVTVAVEALGIPLRQVNRTVQMRVAKCLGALGYVRGRNSSRQWAYFRKGGENDVA